jgi:hypothetical protein
VTPEQLLESTTVLGFAFCAKAEQTIDRKQAAVYKTAALALESAATLLRSELRKVKRGRKTSMPRTISKAVRTALEIIFLALLLLLLAIV